MRHVLHWLHDYCSLVTLTVVILLFCRAVVLAFQQKFLYNFFFVVLFNNIIIIITTINIIIIIIVFICPLKIYLVFSQSNKTFLPFFFINVIVNFYHCYNYDHHAYFST